jgi:hypothetical protein
MPPPLQKWISKNSETEDVKSQNSHSNNMWWSSGGINLSKLSETQK